MLTAICTTPRVASDALLATGVAGDAIAEGGDALVPTSAVPPVLHCPALQMPAGTTVASDSRNRVVPGGLFGMLLPVDGCEKLPAYDVATDSTVRPPGKPLGPTVAGGDDDDDVLVTHTSRALLPYPMALLCTPHEYAFPSAVTTVPTYGPTEMDWLMAFCTSLNASGGDALVSTAAAAGVAVLYTHARAAATVLTSAHP